MVQVRVLVCSLLFAPHETMSDETFSSEQVRRGWIEITNQGFFFFQGFITVVRLVKICCAGHHNLWWRRLVLEGENGRNPEPLAIEFCHHFFILKRANDNLPHRTSKPFGIRIIRLGLLSLLEHLRVPMNWRLRRYFWVETQNCTCPRSHEGKFKKESIERFINHL